MFPRSAIAGMLAALAGTAALLKVRSYDLWWHLETGRLLLFSRSIPRVDDYSFTSAGAPWIDHEWISQILLYFAHAAAGPLGLVLLKAACALGVAVVGYASLRSGGTAQGTALGIVSLAMLGLRFRLAERPETIALPMAAGFAAMVMSMMSLQSLASRTSASNRPSVVAPAPRLLVLGLLTMLWANLHASALLAPALAGAIAAGSFIDSRIGSAQDRRTLRVGSLNALSAATVAAASLLVNPAGWMIYMVPFGISGALAPANVVNPEWTSPTLAGFPFFFAALSAAAATALVSIVRRRPLSFARAALLLPAALLALTSVRHIGLFFALVPLTLDTGGPTPSRWLNRSVQTLGVGLLLASTSWMILAPPAGAQIGVGIAEDRFPVKAADFIDANIANLPNLSDARFYNDVSFGGYLIWRGYPARRVFIDGRNEVHAALLRDLSEAIDDGRKWKALLARHGVEGAVVSYRDSPVAVRDALTGAVTSSTFSEVHFPKTEWALVYWDDVAMVFVNRTGRLKEVAGLLEYRHCRPEAWRQDDAGTGIVAADPGMQDEIRRKLAEDAGCELAKRIARVYGVPPGTPTR